MYEIYQVKPGETLETIARNLGITVEDLYNINGFGKNTQIKEGMNIIIPRIKRNFFDSYTVKKGDTLTKIANDFNMTPKLLAQLNGKELNDYIYEGEKVIIPKQNVVVYITEKGDTLESVAYKINIPVQTIVDQNKTIFLLEGQFIFIEK